MSDNEFPNFSGKCLSLRIIDSESSHDLFDPKFENQAGRLFLVGTIPSGSSESGWDTNKTGAIAWELVRNYVVFDSLADFTRAIEISENYQSNEEQNT